MPRHVVMSCKEVFAVIVISRGLARSFRAVARKCVAGRPRGPAPSVVFEARGGTLTAWAKTGDAALVYSAPTGCSDGVLVAPMDVLAAAEGAGDDPVELAVGPKLRGEACFADRGVPRVHPFDAILPGRQHRPPEEPTDWHPAPPAFLRALHECGRATARESGRFALSRVQVRGRAGRVVGTDGRTALVWGGFDFPFADDLLVPALPAFGSRELAGEEVRVGRIAAHLVVGTSPWRVYLPADTAGRYPDVAGVVPRDAPTVAGIDDRDAAELIRRLPGLPGADADDRPVTLDLDGGVAVRARDDATGRVETIRLERSPSAGPPARVVLDRRALARALALGCVTVRVAPGKPVVFEGDQRMLVTVALDPALAAGTDAADTKSPERRPAVSHETNGHTPTGRPDPPAGDAPDPLVAAEELRLALADALGQAGRLVAALKSRRKEQKALTQVWSSLKALRLGPEGRP
jgi:hypothetical protein